MSLSRMLHRVRRCCRRTPRAAGPIVSSIARSTQIDRSTRSDPSRCGRPMRRRAMLDDARTKGDSGNIVNYILRSPPVPRRPRSCAAMLGGLVPGACACSHPACQARKRNAASPLLALSPFGELSYSETSLKSQIQELWPPSLSPRSHVLMMSRTSSRVKTACRSSINR